MSETSMNLATVWEAVSSAVPDAPALVHGAVTRTWSQFENRAARLAMALSERGVGHDSKVCLYLYNCPEYLEATFAAFKVRAATVNVNYRYVESELRYLFSNSDAEVVVFHAEFADRLDSIRDELTMLSTFICVGANVDNPVPGWAEDYEALVDATSPMESIDRSGDDLWLLYTGGTTGNPKGVMWPHRSLLGTATATFGIVKAGVPRSVDEVVESALTFHEVGKAVRLLPAAPLMHGTSAITSMAVLSSAGCVITLDGRSFSSDELCAVIERDRPTQLTIVGDAFAKPMLAALETAASNGRPYDISSLKVIVSSGVMWSQETKEALLGWTNAALADTLGSSEGVGFGSSVARREMPAPTARFSLGPDAKVFDPDGNEVMPGSGERGLLAVGGPIPVGYYKDPGKTAATFRTFDGQVFSVPGDWATVEADGTIRLLGRGSACINTAGEKVYPEEVEEVLKRHPIVSDANVVGMPDEKWGSSVNAVVSLDPATVLLEDPPVAVVDGSPPASIEQLLIDHCRSELAGYKCPKRLIVLDEIHRGPNGKPDYRWAAEQLSGRR